MKQAPTGRPAFWASEPDAEIQKLKTTNRGLSAAEAGARLVQYGPNTLNERAKTSDLILFLSQFRSPIMILLMVAAGLSAGTGDPTDASIIFAIIIGSNLLSFFQERGANGAIEKLLGLIQSTTRTLRDGNEVEIPTSQIVPGDVVLLHAGDIVPADGLILTLNQLSANESTMTGESFPVEKQLGAVDAKASLSKRMNSLFAGTFVQSGSAELLVCATGRQTELGSISDSLRVRPQETDFELGIRIFGMLLMEVTLLLTFSIFAINVYLHKPVLDSFMFALALAVGLTPQLLPAIISINLTKGAQKMAKNKVIVKRLAAIENFGSMNIFCSDKTGTLTEGAVQLSSCLDPDGKESQQVHVYAFLNAKFQSGYDNPIDQAIVANAVGIEGYTCLQELPYDFQRKRLSVLVKNADAQTMITKGELKSVLSVCQKVGDDDIASRLPAILAHLEEYSKDGYRTIGLATKQVSGTTVSLSDEAAMSFVGFLLLLDPLKENVQQDIQALKQLGIRLKMITGDNRYVASTVGKSAGIENAEPLTGDDLHRMSDAELAHRVKTVDIFAEVDPDQKRRTIVALQRAGYVVGYLGDGINDAPALHAADVGISVSNAADVAREAADFVLLEKDLGVLQRGVIEGRTTFANTLKYVFMATSANFGNMFSMAGASLFLPFLPLLPKQILLGNMLTDFPEMSISTDSVDPEMIDTPQVWDIHFIKKFMVVFGLANSACDYLTFGILLLIMHATNVQFRTGWFIENIVTAALIVLVIRTRKPFWKSRPSPLLMGLTGAVVVVSLALPYTPLAHILGLEPLSGVFMLGLAGIMVFYIIVAEFCKAVFYRKVHLPVHPRLKRSRRYHR